LVQVESDSREAGQRQTVCCLPFFVSDGGSVMVSSFTIPPVSCVTRPGAGR